MIFSVFGRDKLCPHDDRLRGFHNPHSVKRKQLGDTMNIHISRQKSLTPMNFDIQLSVS